MKVCACNKELVMKNYRYVLTIYIIYKISIFDTPMLTENSSIDNIIAHNGFNKIFFIK